MNKIILNGCAGNSIIRRWRENNVSQSDPAPLYELSQDYNQHLSEILSGECKAEFISSACVS